MNKAIKKKHSVDKSKNISVSGSGKVAKLRRWFQTECLEDQFHVKLKVYCHTGRSDTISELVQRDFKVMQPIIKWFYQCRVMLFAAK